MLKEEQLPFLIKVLFCSVDKSEHHELGHLDSLSEEFEGKSRDNDGYLT